MHTKKGLLLCILIFNSFILVLVGFNFTLTLWHYYNRSVNVALHTLYSQSLQKMLNCRSSSQAHFKELVQYQRKLLHIGEDVNNYLNGVIPVSLGSYVPHF